MTNLCNESAVLVPKVIPKAFFSRSKIFFCESILGELIAELETAFGTSQNSKHVPIKLMPETKNVVSNSPVLVPVVKLNRVQSKDSASLILQSNHKKLAAKGSEFMIIHFELSKKTSHFKSVEF